MKTTMKTIGLAAVATLALVGCGGGSGGEGGYQAHPYDAPQISEAKKAEYLNAINQARSVGRNCGTEFMPAVAPLKWSNALYLAALEHNEDMISTKILSHAGSGTASDWTAQVQELDHSFDYDRASNNGFNGSVVNENVGVGFRSTEGIVKGWLDSPGHCDTLMSDLWTDLGMAGNGNYWTQVFGRNQNPN